MSAYYNEFNPYAAQWLRNLIDAGMIAPGIVDERSIEDVAPEDLRGFTQVHLFAGIGGWSLALRAAGVPDDYPIWSASTPCQPFSAAGAGAGFADERHLWPTVEHLARECRPARIVGEQVASRDAEPWLDLVQDDMEALGYAFGAVAFPSAGVGAPHIRDRTYWVANANDGGRIGRRTGKASDGRDAARFKPERLRNASGLADAYGGHSPVSQGAGSGPVPTQRTGASGFPTGCGALRGAGGPGPTNGRWADADWLRCRDGKWRPVEPGTFPLAHGATGRVGRLRACWDAPAGKEGQGHRAGRLAGYGNAINIEAARIFIECAFGTVRPVVEDLSDLI